MEMDREASRRRYLPYVHCFLFRAHEPSEFKPKGSLHWHNHRRESRLSFRLRDCPVEIRISPDFNASFLWSESAKFRESAPTHQIDKIMCLAEESIIPSKRCKRKKMQIAVG